MTSINSKTILSNQQTKKNNAPTYRLLHNQRTSCNPTNKLTKRLFLFLLFLLTYNLQPTVYSYAANFSGTLKEITIATPNSNNQPAKAVIKQTIISTAPLTVKFDASDSLDTDGTIQAYHWNLGDGIKTNGVTVTHQYQADGPFVATLTVTDNSGNISIVQADQVENFIAYEDAEDGLISRWTIYDNIPTGAVISNIYDSDKQSRVIKLQGAGGQNGYRLRRADGSNWNDTANSTILFSINYSESFEIYVDIMTSAGQRYLYYQPRDTSALGTGGNIQYGLGSTLADGSWHTITRNLKEDLLAAQPTNALLAVNGILIRGSGKIDDVLLK